MSTAIVVLAVEVMMLVEAATSGAVAPYIMVAKPMAVDRSVVMVTARVMFKLITATVNFEQEVFTTAEPQAVFEVARAMIISMQASTKAEGQTALVML